jgi:hypothetical protein
MLLHQPAITPKINIVPLILRRTLAHAGRSPRSTPMKSVQKITLVTAVTALARLIPSTTHIAPLQPITYH